MTEIPAKATRTPQSEADPLPLTVLFARGVLARLAIWSTLRIAVQENWGGPDAKQKPPWIASCIVDSFEQESEYPDEQYIEDMLLQIMEDEFEVNLEDDSAASVARDIVRMWTETREGKDDAVRKFEELAEKVKGNRMEVHEEGGVSDDDDWEDDEEGDEMDVDEAPRLMQRAESPPRKDEPEVDGDGFTLVKAKGKSRR